MSNKYRIKPVIVSAVEWTGNNTSDVIKFAEGFWYTFEDGKDLYLSTDYGMKKVLMGDYIIRYNDGKFDVCEPYTFEKKYERWDENL